jgi:hypothetical protein
MRRKKKKREGDRDEEEEDGETGNGIEEEYPDRIVCRGWNCSRDSGEVNDRNRYYL